jgi:2-haloacid dehalogenase
MRSVVTFDVFSALIDSRTGGSRFLSGLLEQRGWAGAPTDLFDQWDSLNKGLHRAQREPATFRDLSVLALQRTYASAGLPADGVVQDADALLASMADWPLWPDVSEPSLRALPVDDLGLLSNIDDDLLGTTRVARLGVFDPAYVVTSERLGAFKPSGTFYERAAQRLGDFTHIASSARDVRGALSAGIDTIRLARPGHQVDPDGPVPTRTASGISELQQLLVRGG